MNRIPAVLLGIFLGLNATLKAQVDTIPNWMEVQQKTQMLIASGKYTDALKYCEEVKKKSLAKEGTAMGVLYAFACNQLALVYETLGKFQEAKEAYSEAAQKAEKLIQKDSSLVVGDQSGYFAYTVNLGQLYYQQSNYAEALKYYKKVEKYQPYAPDADQGAFFNNMGLIYVALLKMEEAEKNLLEAYIRFEKLKKSLIYLPPPMQSVFEDKLSTILINLFSVYDYSGKITQKDSIINHIEGILANPKNEGELLKYARLLNNLGVSLYNSGKFKEAKELFEKALEILKDKSGGAYYWKAQVYYQLGIIYLRWDKNLIKSKTYFLEAESLLKKYPNRDLLYISVYYNLAYFYELEKDYDQAKEVYDIAMKAIFEDVDRNFYVLSEKEKNRILARYATNMQLYNAYCIRRSPFQPDITTDIYNQVLLSKGLLLNSVQKIAQSIKKSGDEALINLYQQWQDKKQYISKLYQAAEDPLIRQQIREEEKKANTLEAELSSRSQYLAKSLDKKRYTWQDVQSRLRENEAAVEIVRVPFTQDSLVYIALIITPQTLSHPEMVILPNGKELEGKYFTYYKNQIIYNKTIDRLSYEAFWAKIAQILTPNLTEETPEKKLNVFFSGDGVYHAISLGTLFNTQTNRYLFEEIDLILVNSTREIIHRQDTPEPRPNKYFQAILMGNPDYDISLKAHREIIAKADIEPTERSGREDYLSLDEIARTTFEDLPGTENEVRTIHQLLKSKGWTSNLYIGKQAVEEVLKQRLEQIQVLHIATHGFFVDVGHQDTKTFFDIHDGIISYKKDTVQALDPMLRTGIVLAGVTTYANNPSNYEANAQDGLLTAYEVLGLNLDKAELVTLSACQTAQGEIQHGEGVYGLQRAFQIAGAKMMLMSLWKVDDASTRYFMEAFYEAWLSGKTRYEALTIARQKTRDYGEYQAPYYWGAFVLSGLED